MRPSWILLLLDRSKVWTLNQDIYISCVAVVTTGRLSFSSNRCIIDGLSVTSLCSISNQLVSWFCRLISDRRRYFLWIYTISINP